MSVFDDDGMSGLLHDDLNENIIGNELPSGSEDEEKAEGDADDEQKTAIKVEPKKRLVRNPRPRLTVELLKGPRGIHTIENYFQNMKFAGKGHENRDLNEIMKRLQHWAHRMYPNYSFDDILLNVERLSKKKPLQIHMNSYRQGLLKTADVNNDIVNDDNDADVAADEPFDEFDALIGEQIEISKRAGATPRTPRSVWSDYSVNTNAFTTPKFAQGNAAASTPYQFETPQPRSPRTAETPEPGVMMDSVSEQGTSLGGTPQPGPSSISKPKLSSEQLALIAENRRKAQERLRARAVARAEGVLN